MKTHLNVKSETLMVTMARVIFIIYIPVMPQLSLQPITHLSLPRWQVERFLAKAIDTASTGIRTIKITCSNCIKKIGIFVIEIKKPW